MEGSSIRLHPLQGRRRAFPRIVAQRRLVRAGVVRRQFAANLKFLDRAERPHAGSAGHGSITLLSVNTIWLSKHSSADLSLGRTRMRVGCTSRGFFGSTA